MKLTNDQETRLKDAVYKIADAKSIMDELNEQMESEGNWNGQGDITAICSSLDDICQKEAGGIGGFLESL